jgi:hypothetical protein
VFAAWAIGRLLDNKELIRAKRSESTKKCLSIMVGNCSNLRVLLGFSMAVTSPRIATVILFGLFKVGFESGSGDGDQTFLANGIKGPVPISAMYKLAA